MGAEGAQEDQKGWVLVVDDEPPVAGLMNSILTAQGYRVLQAHSAMSALEQSRGRERDISLLITDVRMPDLNGAHLAELLLSTIPKLRVLFVSGWEPEVIVHQGAFRRGFKTLSKPFSPSDLLNAVTTTLEMPSVPDQTGRVGGGR